MSTCLTARCDRVRTEKEWYRDTIATVTNVRVNPQYLKKFAPANQNLSISTISNNW